MEVILSWISVALGVAGLAFGLHQSRLKERMERLSLLQAWDVFQSAYSALGWLNNALGETDTVIREQVLGKAHARTEVLYKKSIHNLYTHQEKVTPELIERWISEGRVEELCRKELLKNLGEKYET